MYKTSRPINKIRGYATRSQERRHIINTFWSCLWLPRNRPYIKRTWYVSYCTLKQIYKSDFSFSFRVDSQRVGILSPISKFLLISQKIYLKLNSTLKELLGGICLMLCLKNAKPKNILKSAFLISLPSALNPLLQMHTF